MLIPSITIGAKTTDMGDNKQHGITPVRHNNKTQRMDIIHIVKKETEQSATFLKYGPTLTVLEMYLLTIGIKIPRLDKISLM